MRIQKNIHFIVTFTPTGQDFRRKLQVNYELINNSQIIFVQNLNEAALTAIGNSLFMEQIDRDTQETLQQDSLRDARLDTQTLIDAKVEHEKVQQAIIMVYLQSCQFAKVYQKKYEHTLFITPAHYIRSMDRFRQLVKDRRLTVMEIANRYKRGMERIKLTVASISDYYKELQETIPILT